LNFHSTPWLEFAHSFILTCTTCAVGNMVEKS
jgi:hypothetical protein